MDTIDPHDEEHAVLLDDAADEATSFCPPASNMGSPAPPPGEPLVLRRHLYTQSALHTAYTPTSQPPSACHVLKKTCALTPRCLASKALGFFPIVRTVRTYKWKQWIASDILSGLSVGFVHLPLGLGFGLLSSLSPIQGLYTTFFPILTYLLFGTSPYVSMGTNAVIALLTAGLVEKEAGHWQAALGANHTVTDHELLQFKVGMAAASCFVGGVLLLGMGLLRLGFLTNFMASSFIGGFTFSAAVHICTSQIVKLLHLHLPMRTGAGKLVLTYIDIFTNIHKANPGDIVVGLVCMAVLLGVKLGINERFKDKLKIPVPIELLVIIVSTMVSHFAHLHERYNVAIVGDVPTGLPAPSLPPFSRISSDVVSESLITAILIFVLTISLAKLTARLHGQTIDDNQELVAYGLCQLVGSFFQNFPSCTAPPRQMILSSLGARSALNGLVSAAFILLVLLVLGPLFVSLPIAMLSAMILVAMKDLLLQARNLKRMWNINKSDFFIWLITAFSGVFGDLDIGLLVGVVFSMVTVLAVSQLAAGKLLGKAEKEDVITELDRKGISPIPGVKIFRFESALYFASQERFKRQLLSLVKLPKPISADKTVDVKVDITNADDEADRAQDDTNGLGHSPNKTEKSLYPSVDSADKSQPTMNAHFLRNGSEVAIVSVSDRPVEGHPKTDIGDVEGHPKANIGDVGHTKAGIGDVEDHPKANNGDVEVHPKAEVAEADRACAEEVKYLILDCSGMGYIDLTGVETLLGVVTQFREGGVEVLLAAVPTATLATLARAGVCTKLGDHNIFYSVFDALAKASGQRYINVRF